jgi:hypothetical protein
LKDFYIVFNDGTLNIYIEDNYKIEILFKEQEDKISSNALLSDERIRCSKDHSKKTIKLTNDNNYNGKIY